MKYHYYLFGKGWDSDINPALRSGCIAMAILALFQLNFTAHSQPLEISQYGVGDGLPTYFTKDIIQDSLGYVYIASDEGLSVFNGLKFNNYTKSLQSKYVKHLYKDSSGAIFVVTDGGISKATWKENELQFSHFITASQQLKDSTLNYPKEIYQDKEGFYWVSEPNALSQLTRDGDIIKRYLFPEQERSTSYFKSYKTFELNKTLFTISEKGGIYKLNRQDQVFYRQAIDEFYNEGARIENIFQTDDNTILIAATNGLYVFAYKEGQSTLKQLVADKHVTAITAYQNGNYLFSTNDSDLYSINKQLDPASIKLIMKTPLHDINNFHRGAHQAIWATSNQGIAMFKPKLLFQTPFPDRLQFTRVIKKTKRGEILVANNTSLYHIEKDGDMYSLSEIAKLKNGQIRAAAHSPNTGSYWLGDQDGTLHQFKNNTITTYDIDPKPSDISTAIDLLFEYNGKQLWIVREEMPGIIIRNHDGKTKYIGPDRGLSSQVSDILQTDNNDILLGADGADKYLYLYEEDQNVFTNISYPLPFSTEKKPFLVYDISAKNMDKIYLATNYGILIHTNNQIKRLNLPANFPTHLIRSVEVKNDNFLWLGTENGLYSCQDGYLRPFNNIAGESNIAVNFRSLVRDRNSHIWAGTIFHGLIHIPWDLTSNDQTPAPEVTEIIAGGTPIETRDIKVLNNQQVEFQYHSMIYPSDKVYYQTRIPKLSEEWSSYQPTYSISKSNLPAGNYQLQIRALHSTHLPSSITAISFKVVPPWYARWFTITSGIIFISLLSLLIYFFRRETIKRKLTQIKLRKTEQKLHAIISNTPIILFVINKDGYFILCEGKGLKQVGYEPSFFKNKHYRQIFLEAYYRKIIKQAMEGKEVKYERSIKDKTLSSRLHPVFDDDHNVIQVIGISIDITERAKMEHKLLKAKNEAVRANEAKSTFLANMSHELRTPLNAILGYTQILTRHKNVDPTIREHLDVMYKSGRHLLNMINDILDLSKIESGQLEIHKSNVNFRTLLEEVTQMFKPGADEKNLNLELIYSSDLPHHMMLDEDKIRQITINMVSNAITYTEKGSVVVKAEPAENRTNMLAFSVSDTGIGIPKEQLQKIFTPFIQSDPGAKKGTGLGLSITKNLVEKMGGKIDVNSTTEPPAGTSFIITLPYKDATSVVEEKRDTQIITNQLPKLVSSQTALLADDIPENLHMLESIMGEMGFNVVTAKDGQEAVELFKLTNPDIVITDIIMPKLSGKEAFHEMRALSPNNNTPPIIALTASGMRSSKQELLNAGFDAYFRKPFEITELAETIMSMMGEDKFVIDDTEEQTSQKKSYNSSSKEIYSFLKQELDNDAFEAFEDALLIMDKSKLKNILKKHELIESEQVEPLKSCLENSNFRLLIELNELTGTETGDD